MSKDNYRDNFIKSIKKRITKLKLYDLNIKVFYDNLDNMLNCEQYLNLYCVFGIQDIINDEIIINELLNIQQDLRDNYNILFDSKEYCKTNYTSIGNGYYQIEL